LDRPSRIGRATLAQLSRLGKRAGLLAIVVSALAALLLAFDALLLGERQRPAR
jgi:hypothetical protein